MDGGGGDSGGVTVMSSVIKTARYYLAEHPLIVNFRWSEEWGSTWSFLFTSLFLYVTVTILLHFILVVIFRHHRRPIPLGPIPAAHSLLMALISLTIFAGILFSTAAEIRETRWFWRKSKTPFQWLLCFPLGTRPSGRVFFWSYAFYLSRWVRLLRTVFTVLRRRELCFFQMFSHSILIVMSFLWLEFSQSFQVLGILFATGISSVVYGYRFWTAVGLPRGGFPFVVGCQFVLLGCNLFCHVGVLVLHLGKGDGGCNGIGAWGLNSVLNCAILMLFLDFYIKERSKRKKLKNNKQQQLDKYDVVDPADLVLDEEEVPLLLLSGKEKIF